MPSVGKSVAVGTALVATSAVGATIYSFRSSYRKPTEFAEVPDSFKNANLKQAPIQLTSQQRAQFEKEGFVVLKGILPPAYIDSVREQADYYAKNYQGVQKWFTKFSGRSAIHGTSQHAGWARTLVTSHISDLGISHLAAQFLSSSNLGIDPKLQLRLVLDTLDIIKLGSSSAKTAPFRKDKNVHTPGLRVWIPLDDITKDTAPTVIVPGSHNWKTDCQTGHFEAGNRLPLCPGFKQLMEEREYWKPAIVTGMQKGDVLFIDTRCLHGWAPNTSIDPHRLALRLTIKPEASNFYQPVKFHALGPMDVVAPQIWPTDEALKIAHAQHVKTGQWPVPEPPFSEFATFALNMLATSINFRAPSEPFRPYGPLADASSNSNGGAVSNGSSGPVVRTSS